MVLKTHILSLHLIQRYFALFSFHKREKNILISIQSVCIKPLQYHCCFHHWFWWYYRTGGWNKSFKSSYMWTKSSTCYYLWSSRNRKNSCGKISIRRGKKEREVSIQKRCQICWNWCYNYKIWWARNSRSVNRFSTWSYLSRSRVFRGSWNTTA